MTWKLVLKVKLPVCYNYNYYIYNDKNLFSIFAALYYLHINTWYVFVFAN